MEESRGLSQSKSATLTKVERKALDRRIAERIIGVCERRGTPDLLGSTKPLRRFLEDLEAGFPPSAPERWIFASVAARRGAEQAKKIEQAAQGRDTSSLRLVTLRIGDRKPTADELAGHLKLLSDAASSCCDYLAGQGLAHPILSALQVRRDRSVDGSRTVLDPHVHGIWDLPKGAIDRVRLYLDDRFAPVWIDDIPVQDLKAAAFYIISGMLDYRDVPSWPDDAIEAVWTLPRIRMIRPAGWFADPSRKDSPKIGLGARQRRLKQDPRGSTQPELKAAQKAASAVKELRAPSARSRCANRRSVTPTVRALASESVNLGRTPTLSEIWFARHVVFLRLRGDPSSAFDDACARFGIPPADGHEAVRVTEALFKTSLFYPGDDWVPTEAARGFMNRSLPLLEGFDDLYRDLGSEAHAAAERLPKVVDLP